VLRKGPLLFFMLCAVCAHASDFRNTSWLMSRDQIVSAEGGRASAETDTHGQKELTFKTQVDGHAGLITYVLEDNRLMTASYTFRNDSDQAVYTYMKKWLIAKYGNPSFEKGMLVGWRLERSEIALTLLAERTCYVAFWEKDYFARINGR
jgi:hypothetical protein